MTGDLRNSVDEIAWLLGLGLLGEYPPLPRRPRVRSKHKPSGKDRTAVKAARKQRKAKR